MPIEMKYIGNAIGVLYVAKGTLTGEEIINADQKQMSNTEFLKKKKYSLCDFSQADAIEISNTELIEIAALYKEMISVVGPNVLAIVANQDTISGASKIREVFIETEGVDWHTSIFRTRDEAEVWLKSIVKNLFDIDLTE